MRTRQTCAPTIVPTIVPALLALAAAACGDGTASGRYAAQSALSEAPAVAGDVSSYFIVTRRDTRRCLYPICGGYFVRQVNRPLTRCANGTLQAECHVADLDFTRSGLSPEQAASFENELFGAGLGLARGELVLRPVSPQLAADTLLV